MPTPIPDQPSDAAAGPGSPPEVWVLTSGRAGDDQQSRRLAEGLRKTMDATIHEKRIVFRPDTTIRQAVRAPSLASIDEDESSALCAPWPDLVISAGWRQVPIVRWIRQASGDRAKLVQFNRPPVIDAFDLVLSAPQFCIPARANVFPLDLPLQEPGDPHVRRAAAHIWEPRLEHLPRPWTVLLVGGSTWPLLLNAEVATQSFEAAQQRAAEQGGSLLVTTSRRTPAESVHALRAAAERAAKARDCGCFFFEWRPDVEENPYQAYLELGDEFVVTADSVSMLIEVVRLGKPLAVQSLPHRGSPRKSFVAFLKRLLHGSPASRPGPVRRWVSERASGLGLKFERDLDRVSERFIERGWASRFPDAPVARQGEVPDDLERALERVRMLLETRD